MLVGVEHVGLGAQRADELGEPLDHAGRHRAVRGEQPRPFDEQVRAGVLDAAPRRAAEGMPADEGEARRQLAGRFDRRPLRAPDVGHHRGGGDVALELGEPIDVLLHRRRENDEVRLGHHHGVVGGDVDGVEHHRLLEDLLAIDADDEAGGPVPPRREGDRAADEPEADDRHLLERRRARRRRLRLDDGQGPGCVGQRAAPRLGVPARALAGPGSARGVAMVPGVPAGRLAGVLSRGERRRTPKQCRSAPFREPRLRDTRSPNPDRRPARGRCCARWPAR